MMNHKRRTFFRNDKGQIVMWQQPNAALWGWVACRLLSMVSSGSVKNGFAYLGTALLFIWAYLEITKGASYFRQALGLLVMIVLAFGYFRQL